MNEALLASHILLWLVVVAMGLVIAVLVRQVGVLHERITPAGALAVREGAQVGKAAPKIAVEVLGSAGLGAERIEVGAARADGRATLLFFLSPNCPVCKVLLPTVKSLARYEANRLDVVFASDGEADVHARFAAEHKLDTMTYVLSTGLGLAYGVSKLPFAALIDGAGVLRARGLVNTREHLESLLEAMDLGVGSIQEYLQLESKFELPVITGSTAGGDRS